jgi:subtilisin
MDELDSTMLLRKISIIAAFAILVFAGCKKETVANTAPDDCSDQAGARNGQIVDGQYIVEYNPSYLGEQVASAAGRAAITADILQRNNISAAAIQSSFGGGDGGFVAKLTEEEATRLKNDPSVLAIEHDRIVALSTCFTVVEPRLITWNITRVGYGNGIGKTAWIIDTGIDFNHPDLTVDQTRSKSFLPGSTSANDENGHGTHVAGIIGAKNNTIGVLGVASGATLISLRVLDKDGSGLLSYILQALSYINSNAKAGDVVNMSLGEDQPSDILDQQIQNIAARGIYFAIAAGNDGELANKYSPARANGTNIYTVSAVDSLDNFASFSNYGNDVVDYATPGVRILSTYFNGRYAYMSGTSMAAPHMAGLLLLRGRNIATSGFARNDPDGNADPIAHY